VLEQAPSLPGRHVCIRLFAVWCASTSAIIIIVVVVFATVVIVLPVNLAQTLASVKPTPGPVAAAVAAASETIFRRLDSAVQEVSLNKLKLRRQRSVVELVDDGHGQVFLLRHPLDLAEMALVVPNGG
jgi:hypothetical protein